MAIRVLFLTLVLSFAVTACDPTEPPAQVAPAAPRPAKRAPGGQAEALVFPVNDPTRAGMDALLEGRLVRRDRCLYVTSGRGERGVLPVWPHGFTYREDDDAVAIFDDEGHEFARTGERISTGGGFISEQGGEPLAEPFRSRVEGCRHEGVWIVSP